MMKPTSLNGLQKAPRVRKKEKEKRKKEKKFVEIARNIA